MLKSGDIVKVLDNINIEWVDKPDYIVIEEIVEISDSWIVAKINGIYKHNDGLTCSTILLENLSMDIMETRNREIRKILDT